MRKRFFYLPLLLILTVASLAAGCSVQREPPESARFLQVPSSIEKENSNLHTEGEFAIPYAEETPDDEPAASTRLTFMREGQQVLETTLEEAGLGATSGSIQVTDKAKYDVFLAKLEAQINADAVDAGFALSESFDAPYQYTSEQDGLSLDNEALMATLRKLSLTEDTVMIELPTKVLPPSVTMESLQNERTLIAAFTTEFKGSKKNRIHNITLAAQKMNGTVLEAGAVLSVNKTIGDRNKKNGWKLASAIAGGKYEDEYGGGVCQLSSTLYNACLLADLEIVERYHHSWPMSYVPIGRDATISTGSKDLRFKNTTSAPLLILTQVNAEGKSITVNIYGKKPEGYAYIEITSKKISTIPAPKNKTKLDESLPARTRETERKSRKGQVAETYKIYYDAQGNVIKKVFLYKDTYSPVQGIVYVSSDLY